VPVFSNRAPPHLAFSPASQLGFHPACLLQFSGGNQQAGQGGNVTSDSLPGAMAAARVNGGVPNQ